MTNTVVEHWRPVPGWEGHYIVSNLGRVSSVDRCIAKGDGSLAILRGRVLVLSVDPTGRLSAGFSAGGKQYRYKVSALVLEAFVGPRPRGYVARHLDDDFGNCALTNLKWYVTPRAPRALATVGSTES